MKNFILYLFDYVVFKKYLFEFYTQQVLNI